MKKLTILWIIIILIQGVNKLNAQNNNLSAYKTALIKSVSAPISATLFINEHPSKKDQFTSEWTLGNITFTNGRLAKNCNLRYNCWLDELIWLRPNDFKTGMVFKSSVKEFSLTAANGDHKTFLNFYDNTGLVKQYIYIEVLTEGAISLYCHRKVSYIKSSDIFSNNHQYYLKKEGEMLKIKIRKSTFKELLTIDDQKALKIILRENHLKFKDEYQLAKALEILNQKNHSN